MHYLEHLRFLNSNIILYIIFRLFLEVDTEICHVNHTFGLYIYRKMDIKKKSVLYGDRVFLVFPCTLLNITSGFLAIIYKVMKLV